jgi:two-component system response regulator FixJ
MEKLREPRAGQDLIVVIDDDRAVRDSLRFTLAIEGFAVRAYPNARELLAEAELPPCRCVVVDQNLPGMKGLDLVSELRARHLVAPMILITSHPNEPLRQRAAAAGVTIIEKPFLGPALIDAVRQSVAQRAVPPRTH